MENTNQKKEWADEFERRFLDIDGNWDADMNEPLAVVRFIRETLASHNNSLVERLEGLKKEFNPETARDIFTDPTAVDGYNQAIAESQELIKNSLT